MFDAAVRPERPSAHEVQAPVVLVLRAAEQDVLVLLGEADIATARLLVEQAVAALPPPPKPAVVELSALAFCDLSGLDALHELAAAAAAAGVQLSFRGASPQLRWLHRTTAAPGHADGRGALVLHGPDVAGVTGASC